MSVSMDKSGQGVPRPDFVAREESWLQCVKQLLFQIQVLHPKSSCLRSQRF